MEMTDLKSKKAIFVCKKAHDSNHIWFLCKGYLIFTRHFTDEDRCRTKMKTDAEPRLEQAPTLHLFQQAEDVKRVKVSEINTTKGPNMETLPVLLDQNSNQGTYQNHVIGD